MSDQAKEAMSNGRPFCYYAPADAFIEGEGYRISVVVENESGHFPTGHWPYEAGPGQSLPYFWGNTWKEAQAACDAQNDRMGLSREKALAIVTSSIVAQRHDPAMKG